MQIRPLYDRIVVKRIEQKETLQGGLYIPDSAKEKPQEGEVVAVGKGKRLEDGKVVPLDVQPGDRILFGKYSGSDIKLAAYEYQRATFETAAANPQYNVTKHDGDWIDNQHLFYLCDPGIFVLTDEEG